MLYLRRIATTGLVAVLAMLLGAAPGAMAKTKFVEPMNQYVVSGGKIGPEDLARAGYDLTESGTTRRKGTLRDRRDAQAGAVAARSGRDGRGRRTAWRAAARAPPSPLTDPTHGYDVFRPWSLTPAPCPTTCATPLKPEDLVPRPLPRATATSCKEVVYGTLAARPAARSPTRSPRTRAATRDGAGPAVLYNAVQHAREWIAAEVNRRLFEYVVDAQARSLDADPRLLKSRELWFVPIVNPDGYDYTFTSKGTRLWRKNLRDNNGDGTIATGDGVDPNRNWPTKWNYDLEGASNEPGERDLPRPGPGVGARGQGLRRAREAHRREVPDRLPLVRPADPLPGGLAGRDQATDAPLMKALAGDDDKPAVEGFDPDVSAELYTTNGDITDDSLTQLRHAGLHGRAGRRPGPGRRRHRRRTGLVLARRLRLPGRRGGDRRPSSRRTSRSRWTWRRRRATRPSPSRTWATRRRTSCRRRSRRPTARRRPSR